MEIQPLNGATKPRHPSPPPATALPAATATYKNCMKNHAAARGGHILDGCCEFMPSGADLTCAACGCHRNFHRRDPTSLPPPLPFSDFTSLHRHHPLQISDSRSPPPISSFYPSPAFSRKRIRTKFSEYQKGKMLGFANRLGWKMQRGMEEEMAKFCSEIGVERSVFKVWMHNHKNTASFKRDLNLEFGNNGGRVNGSSSSS